MDRTNSAARSLAAILMLAALATLPAKATDFVVTSTADTDGAGCAADCTLRQAINAANATANPPHTIKFAIPQAGVQVINVTTALPQITRSSVTIDGYTQPGATPNTLSEGNNARLLIEVKGPSTGLAGLTACAADVTFRGLSINGFSNQVKAVDNVCEAPVIIAGFKLVGSFIGLDPSGADTDSAISGVFVSDALDVTIGGPLPADRNVISGNAFDGILLNGILTGLDIRNNYIGTDPSGSVARPNINGIRLTNGASDVTIGDAAAPNRIAFNSGDGVQLNPAAGAGIRFSENEIYGNGSLGIDLEPNGITPNDDDDADSGPNNLQNFPELTAVTRTATGFHIDATLDRPAGITPIGYVITVYASSECDPSGNGEGERRLGAFNFVTPTGATQTIDLDFETSALLPVGTRISLTATRASTSDTSEFSPCVALDPDATTFTVTSTADTGGTVCSTPCTLRQAINAANLHAGGDRIHFDLPKLSSGAIVPQSALPTISGSLTIDGYTESGSSANTLASASNATIKVAVSGSEAGNVAGLAVCASDVLIRGVSVNGFQRHGIVVGQEPTGPDCANLPIHRVGVQGNFVGLLPSGTASANQLTGVVLSNADGVVGGILPGDRNVISGNGFNGIQTTSSAAARIDGNLIGTDPTGTVDRGNGRSGILFEGTSTDEISAGTVSPNLIRFNREGILVASTVVSARGSFRANDIYSNDNLGIDLVAGASANPDGVTANDEDDLDAGANNLQNYPELTGASQLGPVIRITGSLDVPPGLPTQQTRFAFYANASCDSPSGHGEGELYLGTEAKTVTNAAEEFSFDLAGSAPIGSSITATATFADRTSEFSTCVELVDGDTIFKNSFEQ